MERHREEEEGEEGEREPGGSARPFSAFSQATLATLNCLLGFRTWAKRAKREVGGFQGVGGSTAVEAGSPPLCAEREAP